MKDNNELKEQVMRRIYAAYGTDSGILFGITEKEIVAVIVEFTIRQLLNEWKTESEEKQLAYGNLRKEEEPF